MAIALTRMLREGGQGETVQQFFVPPHKIILSGEITTKYNII